MTEVVTNTAATLQQTLVAERQQRAFGVSGSGQETQSQNSAAVRPAGAQAASAVSKPARPDQSQADDRRGKPAAQQPIKRVVPDPAEAQRASRSESAAAQDKIELKDFDLGRRPAEVVGTVDVVQRFDNNADGRVDLLESQRASRARDSSSTYAARGQARIDTARVNESLKAEQPLVASPQPQAQAPRQTTIAEETAAAPLKKFGDPQVVSGGSSDEGSVPKKFVAAEEIAAQGGFSDGAPVQQKFFGDGAEVVIGRFANEAEVQQKFSDKAGQAEAGKYYEAGTGEQKYYDKVAQSEAGSFAPDQGSRKYYDGAEDVPTTTADTGQQGGEKLYDKAQQVAAQTGGHSDGGGEPKKLYGELELYSDVAGYEGDTVVADVLVKPVTA